MILIVEKRSGIGLTGTCRAQIVKKESQSIINDFLSHRRSLNEEIKDLPAEAKQDLCILHCEVFEVEFAACFVHRKHPCRGYFASQSPIIRKSFFSSVLFYCHQ